MSEFEDPLRGTDWYRCLRPGFDKLYWASLRQFLEQERRSQEVYPAPDEVFRALHLTQLANTKVVIVGQDPYPNRGQADGLAFSVRHGAAIPRTLANIHCELHGDLSVPIPDHGNLERWARHGVLLLNTVLTVRARERDSHKGEVWETFTDAVLKCVDERADSVFILWGEAAKKGKRILVNTPARMIIESSHPSPLSARRGKKPFCGSRPFSRANRALKRAGRDVVDWRLTS